MDAGQVLDVLAKLGNFASGFVAPLIAWFAYVQLRLIVRQLQAAQVAQESSVKAERQRRTIEACRSFHTDPVLCDIKRKIYTARRGEDPVGDLRAIVRDLANYLNFLESLCIGIEQGIYDKKIVFDNLSVQILTAVQYFIEPHPQFNPDGDLVRRHNYHPLLRVHREFVELELAVRAPTTYRADS